MRYRFLTFVLLLAILAASASSIAIAQGTPEPDIDLTQEPGLLWTIPGTGENEILDIVDGTLYFIDEARSLHAVDIVTSKQRWVQPAVYLSRFEVVDGTIYASNNGLQQVYAFDAATGTSLWTIPASGDYVSFKVIGDLVYIEETQAGQLTVVDAATGVVQLRYYGAWWLRDNMLYFGADGMLQGIDARTSELLWAIPLESGSHFDPIKDAVAIKNESTGRLTIVESATGQTRWVEYVGGRVAPKLISDDTIYVRGENAALFALDLDTGELRWIVPTGIDETRDYSVRIVDDTVYIHADFFLAAHDDQTGNIRWSSSIGADYNSTSIVDGTVYSVHRDESDSIATPTYEDATRTLYALDAASGEERWSVPLGPGFSSIAKIVDGVIYVTDDADTLHAIDVETGEERWSTPSSYPIELDFLTDGIAYIASGATVSAIDISSGEPFWSFAASDTIDWPLDVIDGTVIFMTEDGTIYALGDQDRAAAQIAEDEAAQSLADAWDTYLDTDLPNAFMANIAALPGMNVVSFDIGINVDTFSIPEGYDRIIAFPVAVLGGASATWSVLAFFPSADDAATAMTNMSGGLLRSGWTQQEVDGLGHDHACLSLSTAESSQALCYMTRDDALIVSHSTVPVPTPDAALLNVTDLTRAMNDAYDDVARPN